ncbi:MAG TPA: hypothetical protein VFQ78_03425 [Candidatus Udaeobacter sp.]|jgi:hypothetical protein|nr:hypothetical protein [Candidatus Udaeobacter sp.]
MKYTKQTTKLYPVLLAVIGLFTLVAGAAAAAAAEKSTPPKKSAVGFSFAVYGDSRSPMYLPNMETQKEEATNAMVDMFQLVLPEKVAAGVIQKDVKLIYDPATNNHEVWDDSVVEGLLSAFPYLKLRCFEQTTHLQARLNGIRFIFLWTGKYDYRSPTAWPAYEAQMKELKQWLSFTRFY